MNVLLVEDDPSLREGLSELLSELAEIRTASTVAECLAVLDQQPFDLVLADLRIGGDLLGGKKVVAAARQRLSPVVVMSALTLSEIHAQLAETPPDEVLCKPFQVDEVLDLVTRYLTSKQELERWAERRPELSRLTFNVVAPGVEMAVAERFSDREVRWYRLAPGGELNQIAVTRAHALVVEGTVRGGGVLRVRGQGLHARTGWPVKMVSDHGSLHVAVVFNP